MRRLEVAALLAHAGFMRLLGLDIASKSPIRADGLGPLYRSCYYWTSEIYSVQVKNSRRDQLFSSALLRAVDYETLYGSPQRDIKRKAKAGFNAVQI